MKTACLSVISVSLSDVGEPLILVISVKLVLDKIFKTALIFKNIKLESGKTNGDNKLVAKENSLISLILVFYR